MTSQELILSRIKAEFDGGPLLLVDDRQYANTGTLRTMRAGTLERVASVTYDFQINRCHFGRLSARVASLWYDAEPRDGEADWACHSIPELVNTVVIALRGEL